MENPSAYIKSNIIGFQNILDCCKDFSVKNLLYASSSSVYGGNKNFPFSEKDPVNHPVSLYAATKKANELMAHTYSHLFQLPCIGMRFFTVYGPWGRPDMAPMIFAKAIISGEPINLFNHGNMARDFTYIDDVIETIRRLIDKPAEINLDFDKKPDPSTSWAPHMIFNIGNSNSIKLIDFVQTLERELGVESIKNYEKMQLGDVKVTAASTEKIESWVNFRPNTELSKGIKKFVSWYKSYSC